MGIVQVRGQKALDQPYIGHWTDLHTTLDLFDKILTAMQSKL